MSKFARVADEELPGSRRAVSERMRAGPCDGRELRGSGSKLEHEPAEGVSSYGRIVDSGPCQGGGSAATVSVGIAKVSVGSIQK